MRCTEHTRPREKLLIIDANKIHWAVAALLFAAFTIFLFAFAFILMRFCCFFLQCIETWCGGVAAWRSCKTMLYATPASLLPILLLFLSLQPCECLLPICMAWKTKLLLLCYFAIATNWILTHTHTRHALHIFHSRTLQLHVQLFEHKSTRIYQATNQQHRLTASNYSNLQYFAGFFFTAFSPPGSLAIRFIVLIIVNCFHFCWFYFSLFISVQMRMLNGGWIGLKIQPLVGDDADDRNNDLDASDKRQQ